MNNAARATRTPLKWKRRAVCRKALTGRSRSWLSACGAFRVVEFKSDYEPRPTVCYAIALEGSVGQLLSRHRKREPAERACQRHADEQGAARVT